MAVKASFTEDMAPDDEVDTINDLLARVSELETRIATLAKQGWPAPIVVPAL